MSKRDASPRKAMSASLWPMAWCSMIGFPIVWRVLAYSQRLVQRTLQKSERQRPDHRTRTIEHFHCDDEACTLSVDECTFRHFDVLEEHLGRGAGALPEFAQRRTHREAGGVAVHEERTDSAARCVDIGLGEDYEHARQRRIGDPHLATVDHVPSPLRTARVLIPATSEPCTGFGHRVCAELTA